MYAAVSKGNWEAVQTEEEIQRGLGEDQANAEGVLKDSSTLRQSCTPEYITNSGRIGVPALGIGKILPTNSS